LEQWLERLSRAGDKRSAKDEIERLFRDFLFKECERLARQLAQPERGRFETSRNELFETVRQETAANLSRDLLARWERGALSEIETLRGFAGRIAANVRNEASRKENKQYRRMRDQLKAAVSGHPALVQWLVDEEYVVGLDRQYGQAPTRNERGQMLAQRPAEAIGRAFLERRADTSSEGLGRSVHCLVEWAEGPLAMKTLLHALLPESSQVEEIIVEPPTDGPSPGEIAVGREVLLALWEEVCELPRAQRCALLLNLRDDREKGVIDLLLATVCPGVAGLAETLEMAEDDVNVLYDDLPVEDVRIAQILDVPATSVIGLRRAARARLQRRMEKKFAHV
jgi:hypothetical protein